MSKFLSGRLRRLLVGITGYTENKTVVQTTGKVGIGTTDAQQHSLFVVGSTNITGDTIVGGGLTAVGIGSFQDNVYIDQQLYVGGVQVSGGGGNSFNGITTFTDTTDNTLGDPDTGAVQIDGGLGVNKNVTVGAGLSVVGGFNVAGVSTFQSDAKFGDGDRVTFGNDNDTEIYWSGTQNRIDTKNGPLRIDNSSSGIILWDDANTNNMARFNTGGSVDLYHNGTKRLETTGYGVTVYNELRAPNINISGIATIQDIAVNGDFDVYDTQAVFHNDLYVAGNLSIGGTTTVITAQDLKVFDKDIILGITTDSNGNDISTDTTANHGGIAIASTEGNPLVPFLLTGVNDLPDTYKQIMWVKSNSYGIGTTDAWLFNYAVGVGSTLVPNGTRFAVSEIQFTDDTINTPNINVSEDLDVDGHTELDNLNVSGVSTFNGTTEVKNSSFKVTNGNVSSQYLEIVQNVDSSLDLKKVGVGAFYIEGNNIYLGDDDSAQTYAGFERNGRVFLNHNGITRLETTGIGVSIYDNLNVGTGVTVYGNAGIVSAYQFWGDGANLTNTGASLSAASGTERLVLTNLTTGTMVSAATSSGLTFNANTNVLATPNLQAVGISTNGSNFGASGYVPVANGAGGWDWLNLQGASAVNTILNGFTVSEEGVTVGTAGSITQLDFRGVNILASADIQPNGIATITMSETPTFQALNLTGITTLGGPVTAGSSEGVSGQYLRHVGTGVTWANFPTLRTTQTTTASDNQTIFNFTYNVNFLDVFINGVKLTSSEYTATNGTQVVLDSPAFAGDIVEFHSYNTASTYGGGGGGGASNLTGLSDVNFPISLADNQLLQYNSSTSVWENVAVTSLPYATEAYVGLATAGLASQAYVGLATAGLASETYVGLATVGFITSGASGAGLTALTGASAATYGNGTAVPQITVDANGRITNITNVSISGGGGGGTSMFIRDNGSLVGSAGTIDFGTGLDVSTVVAGIVTVTVDGTELTSLSASQLTSGTIPDARFPSSLPSIDGSNLTGIGVTVAGTWNLVSGDGTNYTISGPGLDGNVTDPTIYVRRGQVYQFTNNTGGHPFQIQYEGGNTGGTAYSDGIINNNAGNGETLHWNVLNNAPDVLYYQCTAHTNMWGKIIVLGDVVSEGSWTASAGTPQTIDTITGIANNNVKTAEYTVHIENGSNMQAQKVLVMQDGTTAYSQEYAIMHKSGLLVSMSADINSGNLRLRATPEAGVSGVTTYRITRQTMR